MLWPVLDQIFTLNLLYENSEKAIRQRKTFLARRKIGVCDIVESCQRKKRDASDLGMLNPKMRNVLAYLKKFPTIHTLLFTGGNSKNGPEYFFRKHLKEHAQTLVVQSATVPRIHTFQLADEQSTEIRTIKTISLSAPSGAANRAIGSTLYYKEQKKINPAYNTMDFRIEQYREWF